MSGSGMREIDQFFMKSTSTVDNVLLPPLFKDSVCWTRLSTSPALHAVEALESIAAVFELKSDGSVGPLSLQGDNTQRDKQPLPLTSIGNLES